MFNRFRRLNAGSFERAAGDSQEWLLLGRDAVCGGIGQCMHAGFHGICLGVPHLRERVLLPWHCSPIYLDCPLSSSVFGLCLLAWFRRAAYSSRIAPAVPMYSDVRVTACPRSADGAGTRSTRKKFPVVAIPDSWRVNVAEFKISAGKGLQAWQRYCERYVGRKRKGKNTLSTALLDYAHSGFRFLCVGDHASCT